MSVSPVLSAEQLAKLASVGEERTAAVGDVLYRIGDERYPFVAILEGEAAVLDSAGDEIVRHGASGFLGELNLMTGQTVYLTAVVTQPMRYIAVEREVLRPMLFDDGPLGDVLLSAFIARREGLQRHQGIGVEIFGPRSSAATRTMVDYLRRARLPYTWRDPEHAEDPEAVAVLAALSPEELPLVRLPGGTELRRPSSGEVWRALGIGAALEAHQEVDLVIVGGGPAGLGAAVYGASEGLDTLIIESTVLGGQAGVVTADRELPRLPGRHQRRGADHARRHPGAQVRRADGDAVPGARARAGHRPPHRAARRRGGDRGARRRPRHRRRVPPAAGRRPRGLRGHQRLLRRRPARGPALRRRPASPSSAAATRPRRPRSGSPAAARS